MSGFHRQFSSKVLAFPDAAAVDRQTELAEGPILAVAPASGEPWIGVFHGDGYGVPPAAPSQVIGWSDEKSVCVVKGGAGCLVRTDDPSTNSEIDAFPIACGPAGVIWRSGRVALDDVEIVHAEGDTLRVAGFFGSVNRAEFAVDLRTGRPLGAPYEFDEQGGSRA